MPSRMLREGLVSSKKVAAMKPASQDRFPRYFLAADDFGCFLLRPALVCGRLYPERPDMTPKIVADDLVEFERVGCLLVWKDGDKEYAFFTGWWEHNRRPRKHSRRKTPRPPHPCADPPVDEEEPENDEQLELGSRSAPKRAHAQASAPAVAVRSRSSQSQFAGEEEPPVAPRRVPGGQTGSVLPLRIPKRQRGGKTLAEEQRIERDQERDQRSRSLLAEIRSREKARDNPNPLLREEAEAMQRRGITPPPQFLPPPLLDTPEAQLAWVQENCHASPEEAADVVALVEQAQQARRIPQ